MQCPRCQTKSPSDAEFCPQCGAELGTILCDHCGTRNAAGDNFCKKCGRSLTRAPAASPAAAEKFTSPQAYTPKHLAEMILTSRSALEGERKQVTVLFCDIANSTALAERLGPEAMHALLNRFFELALGEVHRYEGTINQFLGDGFMALFGAPVAHEDHAHRAILAAAGIRRALTEQRDMELVVRTGLNTGIVVVGKIGDNLRMDYTAVGDTTHLAARLQQLAEPGTILLSEATQRLVEGYVESAFLGERQVKGLPPQGVYRFESLKPGAARFDVALRRGLTPLVGRRRELEILERCYHEARPGAVRVVNVLGEAGVGKSRLLYEFRRRLEKDQVFLLIGHCSVYGPAAPFLPFIEVVRAAFRLADGDSQPEIERKLRRGLEMLAMPAEDALPFLLNLLGVDPGKDAFRGLDGEIVGGRTREVLERLLRERCRLSPVALVIDDLHWTDTASEELLLRAAQSAERLPLLVACAYRPEYRPPWAGRENVTDLVLEPLSEESTLHLVRYRFGNQELPDELTRLVLERAEGNPLFAEELTRYLVETGARMEGGRSIVPGTLQDLIMARVDRLPEGPRTMLQVASVIGRRFSPNLVRAVLELNGHMAHYLRDLEAQELIFPEEAERREEYLFKHVLIQAAIYESLLTARRESLHQQVAEAIERSYADRLGEWAEVLAHHWSRTPHADRAVRYLAWAGEKSLRVYSIEEAHDWFRQVVELLEARQGSADDAFLADVLLHWVRVHYYRKDFRGLISLVERYLPRVEALGDPRRLSLCLFWLGFSYFFGARLDTATPLLERALELGEALGDEECVGYTCMGLTYLYTSKPGDHPRDIVDRFGHRGLEIATRLGDVYLASKCLAGLGSQRMWTGRTKEARQFLLRIMDLGRGAGDPRTISLGLWTLGRVEILEQRFEEAIENAEECLRIAPDPLDRLGARAVKGMALALGGRTKEGIDILQDVRRELVAGDVLYVLPSLDIPLGAAMVLGGKMAAGVRWIEEAMRRSSEWAAEPFQAWGHLTLGEIYLQMILAERKPPLGLLLKNLGFLLRTRPFAARLSRRHLEETVRIARKFDMPAFLARGLLDLGLLSKREKRLGEARAHLEEARQIAEREELAILGEKIRQALGSLDRPNVAT